jgi:hypothetical protein
MDADAIAAGGDDMSGIVTRLRNWRTVHLARLHLLMDEAADEMERLSSRGDCPAPDNAAMQDTVGRTLAQRITGLQPMLQYRQEIAVLKSDNNRRADLEAGLREGVQKLQADVRRLEAVIAALADQDATLAVQGGNVIVTMDATLTDAEREAIAGAIAAEHERGSWAWAHTLSVLLERMGDTPAAHATLGEGSEQNRCTLTDDERAAVGWCVEMAMSSATDCVDEIRTLRGLLERLAPPTA